jgi:hypothetical protein
MQANSCGAGKPKCFIQEAQFFRRSQMFNSRKYFLWWNTTCRYNVGFKSTDMLLHIYWFTVTDVSEGLNATFGVTIPKTVKLATLLAMTLKLTNLFVTHVNIYRYPGI